MEAASGDPVRLSALLAPLLPRRVRHDDRVRAGLIWIVTVGEALRRLAERM